MRPCSSGRCSKRTRPDPDRRRLLSQRRGRRASAHRRRSARQRRGGGSGGGAHGYKVAEAQIDRSARLARRLREAGDQAVGPRSDRQALDATEQLVFRAMMARPELARRVRRPRRGNPLKRLRRPSIVCWDRCWASRPPTGADDRASARDAKTRPSSRRPRSPPAERRVATPPSLDPRRSADRAQERRAVRVRRASVRSTGRCSRRRSPAAVLQRRAGSRRAARRPSSSSPAGGPRR